MDVAVEAAMVGAGASLAAQGLAFFVQSQLKGRDADRMDQGVRRQVMAVVDQVGGCVLLARQYGPMDWKKMGQFLDRLQSRIYLWEVSVALTNEQSERLYFAAGLIEIAYNNARQLKTEREPVEDEYAMTEYDQYADRIREMFNESCIALAGFWDAMGDTKRRTDFLSVSYKIDPAKRPF